MNKTGWAFVEVESKTTYPDEIQAHAAGLAEGYLTRDLIWYFYKNVIEVSLDLFKSTSGNVNYANFDTCLLNTALLR